MKNLCTPCTATFGFCTPSKTVGVHRGLLIYMLYIGLCTPCTVTFTKRISTCAYAYAHTQARYVLAKYVYMVYKITLNASISTFNRVHQPILERVHVHQVRVHTNGEIK